MGSAELITLDSLGREWIVGCSGREFLAAVEADLDFLSQTSDGALEEVQPLRLLAEAAGGA